MSLRRAIRNARKATNYGIGTPPPSLVLELAKLTRPPRDVGTELTPPGDARKLALEVTRDMPKATVGMRLAEAMKRCRGGMNPRLVNEELCRLLYEPQSPPLESIDGPVTAGD